MINCLECGCEMVRDYKCKHDCDFCSDLDPDDEIKEPWTDRPEYDKDGMPNE